MFKQEKQSVTPQPAAQEPEKAAQLLRLRLEPLEARLAPVLFVRR